MAAKARKREKTWDDCVTELLHEPEEHRVYRGQRSFSWECVSSLQRAFANYGITDSVYGTFEGWDDWEQSTVSWFRAQSKVHIEDPPDEDDLLSWLVLMQHHGAPTRLIDWTESPFIGVYFAYRDMPPDQDEPAALYVLDAFEARAMSDPRFGTGRDDFHRKRLTFKTEADHGQPEIEYRFPRPGDLNWWDQERAALRRHISKKASSVLPVVPRTPSGRMTAQQTVLTIVGDLAQSVDDTARRSNIALEKVELPARWRADALRSLRRMGITESALFPDIDGVGRETATMLRERRAPVRTMVESLWLDHDDF